MSSNTGLLLLDPGGIGCRRKCAQRDALPFDRLRAGIPFGSVRTDVGIISQTDLGYTFQRNLPDTGLMDYKARFYDPYLNHMTQPDTIVPDPGNPQTWSRYGYALNNPIRYTDPTGHRPIIDEDEYGNPIVDPDWRPRKTVRKNREDNNPRLVSKKTNPKLVGPCPYCSLGPDAFLISFSYAAGSDDLYRIWGVDIVVTNDEIGVFYIDSAGPLLGPGQIPNNINQEQMNKNYVSPQVSATLFAGFLWGESLQQSVQTYEGPALNIGGTIIASGEYIETVDQHSGVPNGNIRGVH